MKYVQSGLLFVPVSILVISSESVLTRGDLLCWVDYAWSSNINS